MSKKEFTVEVKEVISIIETKGDDDNILIGKISWGGRPVKGIDIRKLDDNNQPKKGLTVPFDSVDELVLNLLASGYGGKREGIIKTLDSYEKKLFTTDSFDKMFDGVKQEKEQYSRDKYGDLINSKGQYVLERYINRK